VDLCRASARRLISPLNLVALFRRAVLVVKNEWARACLLTNLGPHLPQAVFDAARTIEDKRVRLRVLAAVASHLSPAQQRAALQAALDAPHAIRSVRVLTAAIPHRPHSARRGEQTIKFERQDERVLEAIIASLTAALATRPAQAYLLWKETLHVLAQQPRAGLLSNMKALLPFILALASDEAQEAAVGITAGLEEVGSWWP
jgi:hypothetical protein